MKRRQIWIEEALSVEGLQTGINQFLETLATGAIMSVDLMVYHCESTREQYITYTEEICGSGK